MARRTHRSGGGSIEPLGVLLSRLRLAQGLSQLRLAELLCATAASPTVSRHEISRWERGERVPGAFWLGWLSVVLETPLERLEAAAAAARGRGGSGAPISDHEWLWRPPTAADLSDTLDRGGTGDARALALAWLAGPAEPPPPPASLRPTLRISGRDDPADILAEQELRLAELRRLDDLVGGVDLAELVTRELREVLSALRQPARSGGRWRRPTLRLVAGYAQLSGWAHADAGDPNAARRAYRVALRAAAAAGDRAMAAHVLGALSHHAVTSDPHEALALAHTGHADARANGSPLLQALLLHRVALAAAHLGERRPAELALAEAERVAGRSRAGDEPPWLYWLTSDELLAMTGRCLAVLGRPLRASRLLAAWRPVPGRSARRPVPPPGEAAERLVSEPRPASEATSDGYRRPPGLGMGLVLPPRVGPRTCALYAAWLARSYLAIGEVEEGCVIATRAMQPAVASGSARAAAALRHLHPLLLRYRDVPVVRRYVRFAEGTFERLADADRGVAVDGGHASVAT